MGEIGRVLGCSQVGLNCKDPMIKFYQSFGFSRHSDFMMLRVPPEEVQTRKLPPSPSSTHMFDPDLINQPAAGTVSRLRVRPLSSADIEKGFADMDSCFNTYFTLVVVDSVKGEITGS